MLGLTGLSGTLAAGFEKECVVTTVEVIEAAALDFAEILDTPTAAGEPAAAGGPGKGRVRGDLSDQPAITLRPLGRGFGPAISDPGQAMRGCQPPRWQSAGGRAG